MKLILALSFLTLSFTAMAEDDTKFAEHKLKMLEGMTHQMAALQSTKSCIEAASDKAAVKKCHEEAKSERKKMKSERMDGRIKRLEAKKDKMEDKE